MSAVMCSEGKVASTGCSRSYEAVVSPKVNVPVYSFSCPWNVSICFVILPVHKIISPVANGSNVPACPTFLALLRLRTFLTRSNDVHPSGLLKISTAPSLKSIGGCSVNDLKIYTRKHQYDNGQSNDDTVISIYLQTVFGNHTDERPDGEYGNNKSD